MTRDLGPARTLRDRIVTLDRLRVYLDNRPGLHADCIARDLHREEIRRRVDAECRAEEARGWVAMLLKADSGFLAPEVRAQIVAEVRKAFEG